MYEHIGVYVRTAHDSSADERQVSVLEQWAAQRSSGAPVRWYRDTTRERPAWTRLRRAIREGYVVAVVVWRLDRLAVTASELVKLLGELRARRARLLSLQEGLDTSASRLTDNVLASVTAYEREVGVARIKAGQAAARAKGKRWGGSRKGRLLRVQPEQLDVISRLQQAGATKTAMSRATGLSRPTVYRLLKEHVSQ